MKNQDQLEEAQGLLKAMVSFGQSKEARLSSNILCASNGFVLDCLQKIKEENAQLEEPLTAEQELTKSYEASIRQLQKYLSSSKSEVSKVESNMAALNEGKLSSLQVECTSLDQELQDMEVRARRGQTKSPDEPNQVTHVCIFRFTWQGEVDRARQAQRDAEKKLASMEA
ncbi:BnaA07g00760D [Brassica napus]|uniref:BnaA07g00760D protein n=1 Tax=Brassica napus TaxID=3708 RepID=A0A078HDR1_BRANA|nr:BnaA07g00760D [Brassica napus]